MSEPTSTAPQMIVLSFAEAKQPVFKEVRGGKFVKHGDDNLYPDYLLQLFNTATKHGAVTSGKATYVAGKGWKAKDGAADPGADAFIAKVNRCNESLTAITSKVALDLEIFYGAYLQIIWNNAGTGIAEVYHLDFPKVRTNHDNTQFYYRKSWGLTYRSGYDATEKVYPAFNPANPRGSQVLFVKAYSPASGAYPMPDYLRALNYILAETEVGKHTYNNSQSGFSASKSITFISGEPSDDEKKVIFRDMKRKFTGAKGDKILINFVTDAARKPLIDDLGASDLTKEDFTAVDSLIQTNIYTGHKITTPALFGIATPGSLGQRTELRDGYEIFKNTYVNDKQQFIEGHINNIAKYAGVHTPLEIIPTEPIDFELDPVTIARAMTTDEVRAKAGLPPAAAQAASSQALNEVITKLAPPVASKVLESLTINEIRALATLPPRPDGDVIPTPSGAPAQPAQAAADAQQHGAETNPVLRNITGKQWIGIKRIIREVQQGKTTDAAARMWLGASLGISEEEISVLLGTPAPGDEIALSEQLSEDDQAIAVFAEYGEQAGGFVVLKSRKVKFVDEADAEIREHALLSFADAQYSELQAAILGLIAKDKLITDEVLAETLGESVDTIRTALDEIVKAGALKVKGDERKLTKPLAETLGGLKTRKSFKVVYSYDGPQDSRNRPFCAKLMELGRYYSRTDIENVSARLGYSVWDRRGGFYHNPATNETTPYCRHTWMSHIVMTNK